MGPDITEYKKVRILTVFVITIVKTKLCHSDHCRSYADFLEYKKHQHV